MGLVQETKITEAYVLSRVTEAEVFHYYFGPFDLKQSYSSPFRRDRNPSCGFYVGRTGRLTFSDLATGEKWTCFAFVAKLFNLEHGSAVYRVACDFGLVEGVSRTAPEMKRRVVLEPKREKVIEIIPDRWTRAYTGYWSDYAIGVEELKREDVYPVKKLYVDGKLVANWDHLIRFAYIIRMKGHTKYKKIYTPQAEGGKLKWITNIPIYVPFGINRLTYSTNRLVITKAQKDRLIWLKYFPDVLGTQNEGKTTLNERTRAMIEQKYDWVLLNQDLDPAGMAACEHYQQYGYNPFYVPERAKELHGIKDVADFVKHYGIKKFEAYLKHMNIL